MKYSEVVAAGLILPKKAKYTLQDVKALQVRSLFSPATGKTLTLDECRFVCISSAAHHDTGWSSTLSNWHHDKDKQRLKAYLGAKIC